jgi:Amidohydrolase family
MVKRLLLSALLLSACASRIPNHGVAFTNGRWFNGTAFIPAAWYSVNGVLTQHRPDEITSTVDLHGEYVVPAYGEAHNHNISRPPRPSELQMYVKQGVLYMMNLNNVIEGKDADSGSSSVDVVYANGGLTGAGGHVVALHEQIIDRGGMKGIRKEDLDGYAFHVVESEAELRTRWPRILAGKPDLIKTYLGFSEEYEKRKSDPAFFGKRGLNPELLPAIVRMAHHDHLRVAVHIETAHDFEVAVAAGADIIAHLPGYRVGTEAGTDLDARHWLISDTTAREAAARGVFVETTALAGRAIRSGKSDETQLIRDLYRRNLTTLRAAGVRLVLGSDFYNGTSLAEALFLGSGQNIPGVESLGVMSNLEIVRLLTETTPQMIFPARKIGRIAEGYEATFLTLSKSPLEELSGLGSITHRFKHGVELIVAK